MANAKIMKYSDCNSQCSSGIGNINCDHGKKDIITTINTIIIQTAQVTITVSTSTTRSSTTPQLPLTPPGLGGGVIMTHGTIFDSGTF